MIAIVDYGVGNLQSLTRAFAQAGAEARATRDSAELADARAVVLPGVGHFKEAMDQLRAGPLLAALERKVMADKAPLLGVCLGMQLLMQRSEEGNVEGLGWLEGTVCSLRQRHPDPALKIPNIGWNTIQPSADSVLFKEVPAEASYYFAHSYAVLETSPEVCSSTCCYGETFVAAVESGHLFATQFHPEKSHQNGLHILRNFVDHVASR